MVQQELEEGLGREIDRLRNDLEVARTELAMYREMATIDPLTELANIRGLNDFLDREIQEVLRNMKDQRLDHIPLSVAYIDLDNFKIINDRYQHEAGNLILKTFARTLLSYIRPHDQASRPGGDEFVLVFPKTNKEKAKLIVSRIYHESSRICHESSTGIFFPEYEVKGLTFSAGISSLENGRVNGFEDLVLDRYHIQDIRQALLTTADHAMYRIKHNGKEGIHTL